MLLCLLLCFSFNNELKCKSWWHKWLVSMVCLFGLAWHLVWIERIWVKIQCTLQCIACLWEKDNAQMDSVINSEVFMSQAPTKWSLFSLLWKNNDWRFLKMTACFWHNQGDAWWMWEVLVHLSIENLRNCVEGHFVSCKKTAPYMQRHVIGVISLKHAKVLKKECHRKETVWNFPLSQTLALLAS